MLYFSCGISLWLLRLFSFFFFLFSNTLRYISKFLIHCPLSILFSRWPNHKIVSYIPTHPGKCVLFMIFRSKHKRTDLFLKQIKRFLEPLSWSMPLVVPCALPIIDVYYMGSAQASISLLPLCTAISLP